MNADPVSISVVIAALDAEATIGAQLHALHRQATDLPYEVLVCDNGSHDATPSVVRRWQERMPNLRLVDASRVRGPGGARNIGVAHARAPLIAFCDADDVVAPGWLAAMSAALAEAALVTGAWEGDHLNSDNRASLRWTAENFFTKPFLPSLWAGSSNNMGVRRSVFEDVGGFEERLRTAEDVDLCWRVQLAGHSVAYCPDAVLHVRKRDGLRAVFRQAYSYGVGDKQLRHRYAAVAATCAAAGKSSAGNAPTPGPVSRVGAGLRSARRMVGTLSRVRSRGDLVDRTLRVGRQLGERFGRIDPSVPQVTPPDTSPTAG